MSKEEKPEAPPELDAATVAAATKLFASRGGKARAAALSPEERRAIASKAGRASGRARAKAAIADKEKKSP